MNQFLAHDLREPIRFGIGIHGGEVIVGDIGYRDHMVFTALGDPVNVAARLQDMTKTLACEAIFSEEVRVTAGLGEDDLPQQQVEIRGRAEPMIVRVVAEAKVLSDLVDQHRRRGARTGPHPACDFRTSEHLFTKFSKPEANPLAGIRLTIGGYRNPRHGNHATAHHLENDYDS